MALLLRTLPKLRPSTIFIRTTTPRVYSTPPKGAETGPPTLQQKLKKAVAEYGSTVIVFHVSISLVSLGTCYLAVSSGLDVVAVMERVGIESEMVKRVATGAGTFAVAYAVHKVFAPVRMMITLTSTPFIVRYLRSVGILKNAVK